MEERNMFMRELRSELSSLSLEKQEDIIDEYLTYFDEQNALGLSDGQVIRQLKNPSDVAKKYLVNDNENNHYQTTKKNYYLAAGLITFDILFGLWAYLAILLIAAAFIALGILIIFAPYTSLSFVTFNLNFTFIIFCILLLGFGSFIIGVMIKLITILINFGYKHLKWLYWLLGGQKNEV